MKSGVGNPLELPWGRGPRGCRLACLPMFGTGLWHQQSDGRGPRRGERPGVKNGSRNLWRKRPSQPIVSGESVYFTKEKIPSIVATLDAPGGEILLIGAHGWTPRNTYYVGLRARQLQDISERARAASSHVVVLADLNTTPWGFAFRDFVRSSGLTDASRGQGLQWTWPARIWPLAVPIDHALVSEQVNVLGLETGPDIGSDHHPLVLDVGF